MKYVYNDGGRKAAGYKGDVGDCVIRAISIACEIPYDEVYKSLSYGCKTERKSKKRSARNGVHVNKKWFKNYMNELGWKWTPTMGIGTGCKVHLHDGELPMGRLIVSVSKHYTTVIDGVIHDTHDPQREVHWVDGNGANGISRRCVYGYWRKDR
jgi:hypothetical protein